MKLSPAGEVDAIGDPLLRRDGLTLRDRIALETLRGIDKGNLSSGDGSTGFIEDRAVQRCRTGLR